jgi:hypothetical protein
MNMSRRWGSEMIDAGDLLICRPAGALLKKEGFEQALSSGR